MNTKLILLALLVSGSAFANPNGLSRGQDGNGGDSVVNKGQVSLLDLAEPGYKFLDLQSLSYMPSIESKTRLFVFKVNVPLSAQEKTWILTSQNLEDIKDEGVIRYQGSGELKQLAIQKDNVILINEPLFKKLDDQGKAALITHEMLISAALGQGYDLKSSVGTSPIREIVRILFNEGAQAVTPSFYASIWRKLPAKANSAAALGFNKVIPQYRFFMSYQARYTIQEPRVLVGGRFLKISPKSALFGVCEQLGFFWDGSANPWTWALTTTNEEIATINSSRIDDIATKTAKANTDYINTIECGL